MQTPKGRKKQIIANVLNGQHLWIDKKEDLLHKIAGLHKEEISFPKCIQAIFNEASQELNKTNIRWGDQTVSNSNYILSLKCQFPKSKIIYLTRDPRAVASSYFKINKKYYTLEKVIKKWKNAYSKFKILENKYPKDVYLLNYDNLVSNFKNEISLLIGWLKEDPALLELNNRFELASHLIEPGSSHHTNLANEISKDSIHKWKNELNTAEIEIIEKHLLEEYVKLCV